MPSISGTLVLSERKGDKDIHKKLNQIYRGMKKLLFLMLSITMLFSSASYADTYSTDPVSTEQSTDHHDEAETHVADAHHDDAHGEHHLPAGWSVVPFVLLLLMIATGPLFFAHFWHHYYPHVAVVLGVLVIGYYLLPFGVHDSDTVIHTLAEYVQFIALLAGLFMAAGGILIKVDKQGKPLTNAILLIIGAVLANFIGTTGASMLLIRPFMRLNEGRIKAYHIVFFIFMVSNVGGSLTPIGDPPLFLGFLKGIPFVWTLTHNLFPWAFTIMILAAIFIFFDARNKDGETSGTVEYTGKISIVGAKNFLWIFIIIGAVFIDPNVFKGIVPGIDMVLHGELVTISYLRECLMLAVAFLSYYFANKQALDENEFSFEPIREVAFIFIGIFFTMMPALQLVGDFAKNNPELITVNSLYWFTGSLSGVLDNAPTYVNFLTASIASQGGDIGTLQNVQAFADADASTFVTKGGDVTFDSAKAIVQLTAISVAAVFFGAMTYIGNAPNFMVKAIAEQAGVKMPSFFGYIAKYSIPILLPLLFLVWLLFFQLGLARVCIDLFH